MGDQTPNEPIIQRSLDNPIDKVTGALRHHSCNPRKTSSGYQATCPTHDDQSPSLTVSEGNDGRVVLHCFAGCAADKIVASVGLTMKDLFPHSSGTREAVATYPYVDEHGTLLFEVIRYSPKDFRQRAADGTWSTKQVRRVLYRLPAVLGAINAGKSVYVAEGERDVETLRKHGVVATTNPGGAGKWRSEYSEALRGADMIIIADKDAPGRKHAESVVESLSGIAASVRVVEAATGKDATDHFAAGHTLNEFVAVNLAEPPSLPCAASPIQGAQLVRIADVASEKLEWLWNGYLPQGATVLIDGNPGLGKSTVLTDLAARVTRGDVMPDRSGGGSASNVIMLSLEDDTARVLKPRLEKAGANLELVSTIQMHDEHGERLLMLDESDIAAIEKMIDKTGATLVTVDPLMAYLPDSVDSYKDQSIRRVLSLLAGVAERTQATFILVRHLTKNSEGNALFRGGGSMGIIAAARAAYLLAVDPHDPNKRILAPTKLNVAKKPSSMSFRITSDSPEDFPHIEWLGTSNVTAEQLVTQETRKATKLSRAIDILRRELANGPRPSAELFELAEDEDISEKTLNRAKTKLGVLPTKIPGFGANGGWQWSLPESKNPYPQDLTIIDESTSQSQINSDDSHTWPNPGAENSWPSLTNNANHYHDERGA